MRRWFLGIGIGLGALALTGGWHLGSVYWRLSNPGQVRPPALPSEHIAFRTTAGNALFAQAVASQASADHIGLVNAFQEQEKASWCGVATAVTVLNARGDDLTQADFFTTDVQAVRSWWATTFKGMPLADLATMLTTYDATAKIYPARMSSIEAFRRELISNASSQSDWLIVNYDRRVLGQKGGGHISPVSAYAAAEDKVLLLDTAAYKYPFHWIPVEDLYGAMATADSELGTSRGWLVVR